MGNMKVGSREEINAKYLASPETRSKRVVSFTKWAVWVILNPM